ncbi:tetratricopeptide repeat protein [Aeromonas caviae]|uniref:tetratricopeptide repeat protein n=1 Tax=Aeromonas caviae TaxID=648 RepID=UPI001E4ABA6C|nr:tetratricopeptide repeat protein [Aeromonas caviae]
MKNAACLGVMYENGLGVKIDYVKAEAWYMKAAEQGLADAQLALGVLFATGLGVIRDHDKAVTWYKKAAEQGQVDAQFNLGVEVS